MSEQLPTAPWGWGTVAADPAWSFADKGSRLAPEGSVAGYQTMRDEAIVALPVGAVVAPTAHLYLWTTDAHAEVAFACVRAWGFRFVQLLHWLKVDAKGRPRLGGGHYYRHVTETVLFAVRGEGATFDRHDLSALIVAPRRAHSAKPRELYERAALVSPEPRLELFARHPRAGWTTWGKATEPTALDQAPLDAPALNLYGQRSLFEAGEEDAP